MISKTNKRVTVFERDVTIGLLRDIQSKKLERVAV